MSFKVGDRVKIVGNKADGKYDVGTIGYVTEQYMSRIYRVSPNNDDKEYGNLYTEDDLEIYTDDDTIQSVMDAVNVEPLSTDAFRRIIEMLNGAVESALDNMDFDKAIEYAVMMRECERMMQDE